MLKSLLSVLVTAKEMICHFLDMHSHEAILSSLVLFHLYRIDECTL